MNDLETFTTRELIDEIMNRRTFMGVIVHYEEGEKGQPWQGDRNFKVHFNGNLENIQVSRLLEACSTHILLQDC